MTTIQTLPRITRFLGISDSGEFGNASCPHCGADGRYVQRFLCEDGIERGAMAGCVKLFPISPLAAVEQKLTIKAAEYAKKGWKLPSWDQKKSEALESFYAGAITEQQALDLIRTQDQASAAYRRRKFSGRR